MTTGERLAIVETKLEAMKESNENLAKDVRSLTKQVSTLLRANGHSSPIRKVLYSGRDLSVLALLASTILERLGVI